MKDIVLKLNDFNNMEYRKGSNEFGGILTRLVEFIRLCKLDNDSGEIVFNKNDFENKSNIKYDNLVKLINAKENGKNLYDFNIIIDNDKIIFNDFNNTKNRPYESIRSGYEKYGVDDFYIKNGDKYINPHFNDIKKSIEKIINSNIIDLSSVLDLSAGTGEVSSVLINNGITNIDATEPFLCNEYEKNIGQKCIRYTFKNIYDGKLDNKKYSTIICSYAIHLCEKSILPVLMWRLSLISKYLVIISPNKNTNIKDIFWDLIYTDKIGKCDIFIYQTKK